MRRNNRRFGIYPSWFGLNQSVPHILLGKSVSPDIDGVRLYKERLVKMPLRTIEFVHTDSPVQTPDGNPVMAIASTEDIDGAITTLVFTKRNIYAYVSGIYTSITPTDEEEPPTSLITEDVEYWSVCNYNGTLVFVNGIDGNLFYYNLSSGTVSTLDTKFIYVEDDTTEDNTIVSAKFCWSFKNYLFLGGITYYDGSTLVSQPSTIVNSNIGEGVQTGGFYTNTNKDAGFYVVEGPGILSAIGVMGSQFVAFKTQCSRRYWYTGGTIPFNSESMYEVIGCKAPGSVVSGRSRDSLYFYGSDGNFYEATTGPIGLPVIAIEDSINPNALLQIRSMYVRDFQEIYWSLPVGDSDTNNVVATYKDDGRWSKVNIPVSAFGEYKRSSGMTWATNPYSSWDSVPSNIAWNSSASSESYITPICGSYDGYIYAINSEVNDNGVGYDSYFVLSTDLMEGSSLMFPKRISQIWAYFDNIGNPEAILNLDYKTDSGNSWRRAGLFNLNTVTGNDIIRTRIPVDIRGNNFLFKVSSVDNFSFIGMEFEFTINNGGR